MLGPLLPFKYSRTFPNPTVMFIWVICFFMFIRTDKTSVLHNTNLMRMINFTATMFFGCALIFDLYKW